jgi:hypothetical protein
MPLHMYTHPQALTSAHRQVLTHTRAHTRPYIHTQKSSQAYTYKPSHMHAPPRPHLPIHPPPTHIHTLPCPPHNHVLTRTRTHTRMHTYTHTPIHLLTSEGSRPTRVPAHSEVPILVLKPLRKHQWLSGAARSSAPTLSPAR